LTVDTAPSGPESATTLDALIVASATGEWMKVAMLIFRTIDASKAQAIDAAPQAIAARIYALVADGRLEAQGNIRRWRTSEVRVKPSP
jgi:hypothetical protein